MLFLQFAFYFSLAICLSLVYSEPLSHSDDDINLPLPHIVIVGATGVGKSSIASVLIGESPLCSNCTFPVCPGGGSSCTGETTFAVGKWLGSGIDFTVVDTPGFQDSDQDDSILIDKMMAVLKESVKSTNTLLLVMKGTDIRLDASLQQMLREMVALFGEGMWNHVVIGVSFWSFDQEDVIDRNTTCVAAPEYCHDENWFKTEMNTILESKFHIGRELTFVFIDSWAKHPANLDDIFQQEAFAREASILWDVTVNSEEFVFKSLEDILNENHELKLQNEYLKGVLDGNITEILNILESQKLDLTDLRIKQGITADLVADNQKNISVLQDGLAQEVLDRTENVEILNGDVGRLNQEILRLTNEVTDNRNNIENHRVRLDNNDAVVGRHESDISTMKGEIGTIRDEVRILSESYRDSILKFHVETEETDGEQFLAGEAVIPYRTELADTHNAMDPVSGRFTAPFAGTYGFIFSAQFKCTYDPAFLYLHKNGRSDRTLHFCELYLTDSSSDNIFGSNSIYFSLDLQAGEFVEIQTGSSHINVQHFPAKFAGFLLRKH